MLIVVLVPILALVLALIAFRSRSGGLSELEARIKTKGEPLTVTDLDAFYASVPDEENGALLLIEAWAREDPLFWDAFRRGAFSLPPRRDTAVDPIVPFLGRDARDFSRTNSLSEAARAAAEDFLATHRERIDLVRAAIRKEHFRFPLQFSNTLDMLMPHLSALMENVRTFRLESLLAIERGDVDGAIGALEGAVQCADVLARTLSQPASVTSFGFKCVGWLAPLVRSRERLERAAGHALQLQLGGAVGTLSRMQGKGAQVTALMARDLGLGQPIASWHNQRDEWVALGCELGLLVGSLGAQQPVEARAWFVAGASSASLLWFTLLGYGARALAPWFAKPRAWQVLDALIGLTMWALALGLLHQLLSGQFA